MSTPFDGRRPAAFTRDSATRIARAVQAYERGRGAIRPPRMRTAADDGGGGEIRLGLITANWNKGATANVQQLNPETGEPVTPSVVFEAKNWFSDIVVECSGKVACANVDGVWILISAEC